MNTTIKQLNQNEQEEIIRLIEYVLEPVQCKVIRFLDPYKMTHRTKHGDDPWHEWEEIFYPVFIKIKSGEDSVNVSSLHIDQLEDAIWRGCHDFVYTNTISEEDQQEILERLYSKEFLEFRKGKK